MGTEGRLKKTEEDDFKHFACDVFNFAQKSGLRNFNFHVDADGICTGYVKCRKAFFVANVAEHGENSKYEDFKFEDEKEGSSNEN